MLDALVLVWGMAAGICVGLMFVVAAVAKFRNRALLPAVVANYRLLPVGLVKPVAAALPWVEGLIGLLLLANLSGSSAAAAASAVALLLAFAFAMELNIRRGRAFIDCGCGLSSLRQQLRRALVVRNLILAVALVPLVIRPGSPPLALYVAAIVAGLAAFLLLLLVNALLALPTARRFAA